MQAISALIIQPIEQYLDYVSTRYCLALSPQLLVPPGRLGPGELAIAPSFTIGPQITNREETQGISARVTILHAQQNSLGSSLRHKSTHRITVLSVAQDSGECCNNRDYCVAAIRLGLEDSDAIAETGGILFNGYSYTGGCYIESSLSPTWEAQFRLWRSRAVLAIPLGGRDA